MPRLPDLRTSAPAPVADMASLFREAVEPAYPHCAFLFTDVSRGAYGPWCRLKPTAGPEPVPVPKRPRRRLPDGPVTLRDALWVAWWFTALGGAEAFDEFRALASDRPC